MARFETLAQWLQWQEQSHPRSIDLGLERVAGVYRQLQPVPNPIPTITVAGTNGKGSCIAYLEAIYRAAGYRVGAYTSPHILRYNERIRIDGQPVSDHALCQVFAHIDQARHDTSLSYFEFGTLAALLLFQSAQLDIQLLEVGLGGRLDAVNIVDADVAMVTTIAIDHVEWLGTTEEAIAAEKAGIFRSNRPAIVGDRQPPQALRSIANAKQAHYVALGEAFDYSLQANSWRWQSPQQQYSDLPAPAFKGAHQYRNAAAVLMAVTALQTRLPVAESAVAVGLQAAQLQGRFQLIPGQPAVLLDVGHNPQAVQSLLDYLQDAYATVKIHAVFAMMKDKDIAGVLQLMRERVSHWYFPVLHYPRAASPEQLVAICKALSIQAPHSPFNDVKDALAAARQQAKADDLIVVFGSFFLVSDYLSQPI